MITAETFHAAADLIAQPGGWCCYALGRDAGGHQLPGAQIRKAVSFCADGALMRVLGVVGYRHPTFVEASAIVRAATCIVHLAHWNDQRGRTQADVVALLRYCADYVAADDAAPGVALAA